MHGCVRQLARLRLGLMIALASLGYGPAAPAHPAPTTGLLHVQARVESGCRVVGQLQTADVDFGTLDFGTYPSLFTQTLTAQAQLLSGALQLRCVGVTSAQVSIGPGLNVSGGQRRLAGGSQYVPYLLYSDAAGTQPFDIDVPRGIAISSSGESTVVDLNVHGRVPPAVGGYAPGAYQDQVQITVSW
jgi:spore coat protein U-like protein